MKDDLDYLFTLTLGAVLFVVLPGRMALLGIVIMALGCIQAFWEARQNG